MYPVPSATRRTALPASRGFTLIELMVTVALVAILLAIGIPSFKAVISANRLSAAANEMVASVQQARIEAIRRNAQTVMCRTTDGATCATGTASWSQWLTFVDLNGDRAPNAATNELLRVSEVRAPVEITSSGNILSNRIIFRADGFAHKANASNAPTAELLTATFGMCIRDANLQKNRRLVSIKTGSRITTTTDTNATCATPSN